MNAAEFVQEELDVRGITEEMFLENTGLPPEDVLLFMRGGKVTPEIAQGISTALGTPLECCLRIEESLKILGW